MRKFLVPLMLVASIGASSMALAAPSTAHGAIQSMDGKACTVTLADKSVYQFAPKCDFSKLKAGEKVAITYTLNGKVNQASAITAG
ncbi:hypothetical protein ASC89_12460 [Devosia sp. Root413D1]|uniref:DUF1344 domain-containing protein n=1 Tax=unclassified Devosia TaxID=196773 RepID=UPI0006F93F60|nr:MULTISPECIES: DUF1344 domain-containing protein [unclassified Devosia]KQV08613.1 hypothetical protein ASC68_25165 [Devosia sp. Root105]KQW79107.1 hypothetical protein ASC89_12460 [Devosia sp. Root413D1]